MVEARWADLQQRIQAVCSRTSRSDSEITLIGASKRQEASRLQSAYAAGLRNFGENRVQEAEAHQALLPADIRWHLIGPLQSNKIKKAVSLFSIFHALDRPKTLNKLNLNAESQGKDLEVFVQVNVGGEASKHGCEPDSLEAIVDQFSEWPHLKLVGLMTLPPYSPDPEDVRPFFRQMAQLRDKISRRLVPSFPGYLSMGMSHDFEVALEEGATHIRIGSSLFGPRD